MSVREELPFSYDAKPFARMLAKIGYSLSVAEFGLDGFEPEPLLLPIIFGESEYFSYLIGGSRCPIAGGHRGDPFWLQMGPIRTSAGRLLIGIQVQLFHHLDLPTYIVAVGKPTEAVERLLSDPVALKVQPHMRDRNPSAAR